MDTDTRAQDTAAPTEQPAPMPSAEPSQSSVTASEAPASAPESNLPEGVSERTAKEFEKLKGQLAEEKARAQYFESLSKQTASAPQPVDQSYGEDPVALAYQANQQAQKALQDLRDYQNQVENERTYEKYPELNPDNKEVFNKDLFVETRRMAYDSMVNPEDYGGKQLSFMEAAALAKDRLAGQTDKIVTEARKEGARDAIEQLTPKEQASLAASGNPRGREEINQASHDELRRRSRKGDLSAIEQRLAGLGE